VYLTNFRDLFHPSNFEEFWDEEDDWQQLPAWLDTIQHLAVPITDIKELGDEKVETIIMGFENLKRLVGVVPTKFGELSSLGVSGEDGDEAIREKMWAYLVGLSGEKLPFRQYRNVWMDAEIREE
jgi:hypothetical protein